MKNFLVILLILIVSIIASNANAAQKHPIDWTEKEVVQYTNMALGKYLNENSFETPNDVRINATIHLVKALQIIKNEGVIYTFDVDSPPSNIINDNVIILVTILKDVSDEEGTQIVFTLHSGSIIKKKVTKV